MRTTLLSILTASAALLLSPLAATQAASADQAPATSPVSLDARAAAAAAGSGIGTQSSWFSGTLSPGASQSWLWNNASSTRSYKAGLSPVGATTSASCWVEVTKSSYAQKNSGELEFRFTIKNVGTISCGANILLSSTTNSAVGATGGLNPGASKSYTWNNAVAGQSHLVGLVPSGATSTADCQFQVTRGYYARQSTGEREFRYTIQNVGSVTCQTGIRMAFIASSTSFNTPTLAAGSSSTSWWNDANPLTRVYAPGLQPSASGCQLEITRTYYSQRLNSGVAEREFYLTVKNVGRVSCFGTVLLSSLQA